MLVSFVDNDTRLQACCAQLHGTAELKHTIKLNSYSNASVFIALSHAHFHFLRSGASYRQIDIKMLPREKNRFMS